MTEWKTMDSAPTWQPKEGQNISLGKPEVLLAYGKSVVPGYWNPDRKGGGRWESCLSGFWGEPDYWALYPIAPQT